MAINNAQPAAEEKAQLKQIFVQLCLKSPKWRFSTRASRANTLLRVARSLSPFSQLSKMAVLAIAYFMRTLYPMGYKRSSSMAKAHGETRSGFLAEAARAAMR
jgi:hypothetical protein